MDLLPLDGCKTKSMNSTDCLTSYYIYFWVRKTILELELTWNSALSSSLARDSENGCGSLGEANGLDCESVAMLHMADFSFELASARAP